MNSDDDIQLHGYQDDFDHKFTDIDPFMDEGGDDPLKEFRVPQEASRKALDDRDEADDNAVPTV